MSTNSFIWGWIMITLVNQMLARYLNFKGEASDLTKKQFTINYIKLKVNNLNTLKKSI